MCHPSAIKSLKHTLFLVVIWFMFLAKFSINTWHPFQWVVVRHCVKLVHSSKNYWVALWDWLRLFTILFLLLDATVTLIWSRHRHCCLRSSVSSSRHCVVTSFTPLCRDCKPSTLRPWILSLETLTSLHWTIHFRISTSLLNAPPGWTGQ